MRDETGTRGSGGVTVEFDVPGRMRDGVTLRANVYRPDGEGPWPTLLARLPYGKDLPDMTAWLDPVATARKGFLVVIQDTRGRFASDGEWSPLAFEREDGYDTVEWAARLPGSNGRVGMYGPSYVGVTQWMAAIEAPPSLGAIAPAHIGCEPLDGMLGRGGALELGLGVIWTLLYAGAAHLFKLPLSEEDLRRRLATLLEDVDALPAAGYWDLPVHDMDVIRRTDVPDLGTFSMLADPAVADRMRVAGRHERVTVPTFSIGGWNDVVIQGTLDNHMAMAALGRPARLIVGPWSHIIFNDPVGELCFGILGSRAGAPAHPHGDLNDEQLAWFRAQLDPEALAESAADAVASAAPVRIFVMGRNEWRDEQEWPLARARQERWFLGGGGRLTRGQATVDGGVSEFVYDPADPVPTLGGQTVLAPAFPSGPRDQAKVEARDDVLVFTSDPLEQDLEVTGRIRVILHAESSAPSTDWVARLCDVHPDGRSFNLCDGIVRVEQGADTPGEIEIDLWSTSNVFLPGHRLRVHVTSSSFPRWDRNLNTGDQRDPQIAIAHQRVHHDTQHSSWIELPVVP